MDETLMRIGELAAFFNVSVKALRVYEKMGILTPERVDAHTGYRYYSADQVRQLDALLALKGIGFSLSEIKGLLEKDLSKEQYMEALVHKRALWQDRMSLAQDKIDSIDEIITQLTSTKPAVKLHTLTEEERAHLLSRMVCLENLHANHTLSEVLWL